MTEADILRTITDYLQIGMNQHKWWYTRLNSGSFFVGSEGSGRMIKGAGKGTADILVIKHDACVQNIWHHRVLFLEVKSEKGKQSEAQREFEAQIKEQGASYFVVRSVDEVEKLLPMEESNG